MKSYFYRFNRLRLARRLRSRAVFSCLLLWLLTLPIAYSITLTAQLEVHLFKDISTSWTTVSLKNSYSRAVPVCTYVLPSFSGTAPNYDYPPAVVRIRNISTSSFDLKIQGWENSAATTSDVHCIVMEEGAHTLPDGRKVEAHTVLSEKTSGQYTADGNWSQAILEDVSGDIVHSYSIPVVLGQVISYNDSRASVFHNTDCDDRKNNPFQSGQSDGICVGKHIGMIDSSRSPETLGYIVAESGSGTVNNVFYELGLGPDIVAGNNPTYTGYNYSLSTDHTVAVLTQGGEDGGNGSWAVLYGTDPLVSGTMGLVVDEEAYEGDVTRRHTSEPVYYWAFAAAEITLTKKVINNDGGSATSDAFSLTASGVDTITGVSGDATVTDAPVHPGAYYLSEVTQPGYVASDWTCSGTTVYDGDMIKLQGGDNVVCTIVNDDVPFSTLTLVKKVINDGGGTATDQDFSLSYDNGLGNTGFGVSGSSAVTAVPVVPGDYKLYESPLSGYLLSEISCDGKDGNGLDGLTILTGEKIICTFVNDDQSVDLQIAKGVSDVSPNVGDIVTFTLKVFNDGPATATNVSIEDVVPAGFSYIPLSISGGNSSSELDPTGTGLSWIINSLIAGASQTLTFKASVLAP